MASTTPVLMIVAVALLVIYISRRLLFRPPKLNLPPGPTPLPIIGCMHLLGKPIYKSLADLAQKYGPLMSLQLGQKLCIVATSAEAAKEFLKVQDANFSSRPPTRAAELILPNDLFNHDMTPVLRHLRKILVSELISAKRVEASKHIRTEELACMVYTISKQTAPIRLKTQFHVMVTNVLTRMILNKRFLGQEQGQGQEQGEPNVSEIHEFIEIMEELPLCFGAIHLQDFFTCIPKWLDLQGLDARFRKIKSRMDVFYTNMISQHREERRRNPVSEEHKTLLDVLLEELEKPEQGVTEDNVNGLIWDILAAGTDTTMLTCEWAMAEILRNPTVLEQATSELDQVIGHNRLVQESDIPELKYMQAIVKEVLRLHPVAPMLIPHQNTHLTKAFGYNIPTQTRLFVNVWAMGRDPCVWEEPLEFRPERFLEGGVHGNTKFEGQHFEYLPFGSGRRSCLGMALASIEVHLMVASLVHAFEWSFLDGVDAERLDMTEGESFFVHLRDPLMVVAKSRLPSHLYQC